MKKTILTAATLLLAVCGLRAQDAGEAQSAAAAKSEWLPSFTTLVIDAPLDIRLIRVPDTEAPKIVYDTKGSYTSKFKAAVKDRVLRITERPESRRPDRTEVTVYYNDLHKVTINDATAVFADTLSSKMHDMTIGGAATVTAALDFADLCLDISGKSNVTLTGKARYLRLYISSAKLDASGLETMSAEVNAQSGAIATLWVTDRFEGKTSTNAKIFYKGDPSVVRGGAKFLGGDITHIN